MYINKVDSLFNVTNSQKVQKVKEKDNININFKSNKEEKTESYNTVKSMILKILPSVSDEFINQILETSAKVKCTPEDLTALIYKESKFNPKAINGEYAGLGQMTSISLKLSKEYAKKHPEEKEGINQKITFAQFKKLSREEQMPYVKNYILTMKKSYVKNMETPLDSAKLNGLFVAPAHVLGPNAQKYGKILEKIKKEDLKVTHTDIKF